MAHKIRIYLLTSLRFCLLILISVAFNSRALRAQGFRIESNPDHYSYNSSGFINNDRVCIVFDSAPIENVADSRMFKSCSSMGSESFPTPEELFPEFHEARTTFNGSILFPGTLKDRPSILFNAFDRVSGSAGWFKSSIMQDGSVANPVVAGVNETLTGQKRPWIRAGSRSPFGSIVTYEVVNQDLNVNIQKFAPYSSALDFPLSGHEIVRDAQNLRGVMLDSETIAFTYQVGRLNQMQLFVVFTNLAGATKSGPHMISTSLNAHDALPFLRLDGGLDIYYIKGKQFGFELCRRFVDRAGNRGPEELLLPESLNSQKPSVLRMPDNRILVSSASVSFNSQNFKSSSIIGLYLNKDSSNLIANQSFDIGKVIKVPVGGIHGAEFDGDNSLILANTFPQSQADNAPFLRLNLGTGDIANIDQDDIGNAAGISSFNDGFMICDLQGSRVLKTDRDLKILQTWPIKNPWNARLGADGRIYVITYNGEFYSISETNEVRLEISGLDAPFDFQFTNDGEVWITEQGQGLGRVAKWQRGLNGVFELALTSNRQWLNPEGIVKLGEKIFVLDTESEELVEVNEKGETATSMSDLGMPILVKENRQELFVYSNSYLGFPSILVLKSK